jgi:hypothetical protein
MSQKVGVVATFSSRRRRFAMSDRETRVRERAHRLWEQEGRPSGREVDHWDQASREIDAEDGILAARKKAPRAKRSAAAGASDSGLKPARVKRTPK